MSRARIRSTVVLALAGGLLAGVALAVLGTAREVRAQAYPAHEIEFIVPFPPGGPADTFARLVQPIMSARLKVPIVVTNRSGGGGAVGAAYVAAAKPDGYTALASTNSPLSVVTATRKVPYRLADFAFVGQGMVSFQFIAVRRDAPWKTLEELIAYAKNNPGKLSYGSPGLGTISFFNMEMLKLATGIDAVHVPFAGSGPLKSAILGGQVAVEADAASAIVPLVRSGDLVALATSAPQRVPDLPDVPTLAEKGLGQVSLSTRAVLLVPAGTPPDIVAALGDALRAAAVDPGVVAAAQKAGMVAGYRDGAATRKAIEGEFQAVGRAARKAGLVH